MEKNESKSRSVINVTLMILSIIVVLFFVPLVFMYGSIFEKFLIASGIKGSPNFNDGYLIAEFADLSEDVFLPLPQDTVYHDARNALDLRKLSIKKVEFSPLSGMGLDARLNLCFEFDGKQPNPFDFKNKFSFPVMHVYIKPPGDSMMQSSSYRTARVTFREDGWKYEVIIDGMHEQARVFDNNGKFLFNGLGLYVNYEYEKGRKGKENSITKTKVTAGLPLKLIGDPASGEWKYYVIVGLLDVKNPSVLYESGKDSLDVYDYLSSDTLNRCETDSSGRLSLLPLIVNYSKTTK
jgi:hypothetical protein